MLSHVGIETIAAVIILVICVFVFSKWGVTDKKIGMKNYKGYQEYGIAAKQFFNEVKTAFQDHFRYPFDRECPNYYFAKIYDEDPRYTLVIDLGNLSAVAIVNDFQFTPQNEEIRFADERTNRTLNWMVGKKMYVYRNGSWEMVSEAGRNDILDMLSDWGMEAQIDLEHAYALSYPDAKNRIRNRAGSMYDRRKRICAGNCREDWNNVEI